MFYRTLIFFGLWLCSWASAQTFDPSNPKAFLDVLGGNPAYLGFILFGIVASGKRSAERRQYKAAPLIWKLLAFSSGMSISLLIHAFTDTAVLFTTGWIGAVLFGFVAGGLAIIGRDGAKTVMSWGSGILSAAFASLSQPTAPLPQTTPLPAPALPPPVSLPAPAAVPFSGDPDMFNLMTLLSSALSLGATPPTASQTTALEAWVDQQLPLLRADVVAVGTSFNMPVLIKLANDTMRAANLLDGVLKGLKRAEVVAITVRFVATTFAPPGAQVWLGPVLASGALENLIESLYRAAFPDPVTPPVVDAPELPSGEGVK